MSYPLDPWILRYYLSGDMGPTGRIRCLAKYIQGSGNSEAMIAVNRLQMDVANAVENFFANPVISGLEELCAANKKRELYR